MKSIDNLLTTIMSLSSVDVETKTRAGYLRTKLRWTGTAFDLLRAFGV